MSSCQTVDTPKFIRKYCKQMDHSKLKFQLLIQVLQSQSETQNFFLTAQPKNITNSLPLEIPSKLLISKPPQVDLLALSFTLTSNTTEWWRILSLLSHTKDQREASRLHTEFLTWTQWFLQETTVLEPEHSPQSFTTISIISCSFLKISSLSTVTIQGWSFRT